MFNMLARNQLPTHDSFRQSACRSASHGLIHVSLVSIRSGCPCKGGVRGQGGREEEEEEEVSRGGHTWPPRAPRRAPRGPARCPPARGRPAGCSVRARGAPRPELAPHRLPHAPKQGLHHIRLRGPSTDWVPSPGVLATPGPSPGEVQLPPGGGMRGGGAAPLASDAAAALPPPERRVLGLFPTTNARMVVGNMPINGVAERGLLAKGRVGAATAHHRQCCGLCRQQPPHGAGHAATARGQAPWRGTGCGNSSGQGSWPRCPYRHRGGRPPGV
ncbi:unnamed protein product [Prorocentrum cordatum]|uniref:Uncharacterized protein n=1 Tax=Prorocentrum cordatum TaxID=2364126 RepID=A0ABN9V5X7_9DINO|nr:unnamed protein product [Polarella glacialis]